MKRKLSLEKKSGAVTAEKLSKSLFTFGNTLEIFMVFGKHYAKETRNVKYVTTNLLFRKLKL